MVNKRKGRQKNKIVYPPTSAQTHSVQKSNTKKRSHQRRAKQNHVQKSFMSTAMSTWAQHFSQVTTWQLKNQIAYWKSRAISLQYENSMLLEVIRNNHLPLPSNSKVSRDATQSDTEESDGQSEDSEEETKRNDTDYTKNESHNVEEENNEDFEVSEEFIQFLTANAKYKEDARRERERLKAKFEAESKPDEPELLKSVEDMISKKKELYGDKYQKIVALEMYSMSNIQDEVDKNKATYWPNIPFNFNVN